MKRIEIARDVIAGSWGSGDKRVAALKKAGYNPDVVQGDVNTLLCCRENIINTIRAWATKTAGLHKYKYIYWQDQYGHECAVCHPHNGENHGWQCIGWTIACWHHGGLPIPCNCGVIDNGTGEKILKAKTNAAALKIAQDHLKIKDIEVIRNNGNKIPKEKAKPGDIGLLFEGDTFQHMILIMDDKHISDSTHAGGYNGDISASRNFSGRYETRLKVLIRYTGNGLTKPAQKSVDEVAHEVIEGLWGSGDSRKRALTEAGHNYNAVQKRVNEILNPPKPEPKKYPGKLPTTKLVKTEAEVIADALKFAKWIIGDNRFGYGRMGGAAYKGTKEYSITHSGGCHFCGSNAHKISEAKKAGIKNPEEWEYTYVCNTFVHACYAHAGVPSMLNAKGHAWWTSSYQKSSYWTEVHPKKVSDLKPGDVLGNETHYVVYIGGGKGVQATSRGNARTGTKEWAKCIDYFDIASFFKKTDHVFRLTKAVNSKMLIRYGEVSYRVEEVQNFLDWYYAGKFFKECGPADGCYGDNTLKWVKKFQTEKFGAKEADGLVGEKTLAAMAAATK